MMDHIFQILGVIFGGTTLAAAIAAYATRKKVGAETNQKIVATSGELIDEVREDAANAREERNAERRDRIIAENRQRRWWERADEHVKWDRDMIRRLEKHGEQAPMPPPLYPPPGD